MDLEARNRMQETSADMAFPLPLTEEQIDNLSDNNYTQETPAANINSLLPRINPGVTLPNINVSVIPIIPGVTRSGYIRFLNANASIGPVDIYVNGRRVARNLSYRAFTEYMRAFPGYYRVAVFRAGTIQRPLYVTRLNVIAGRIYTAAVIGTMQNVSMQVITDTRRSLNRNQSFVRFVQLSPNAPSMDVYVDNRLVVSDLQYQEISRYLALIPGEHNLKLKATGTNRILLEDPSMVLGGGKAYTVYVVGNINERPGLQVLIPLEGASYLIF